MVSRLHYAVDVRGSDDRDERAEGQAERVPDGAVDAGGRMPGALIRTANLVGRMG